jgi:hypothetical protein
MRLIPLQNRYCTTSSLNSKTYLRRIIYCYGQMQASSDKLTEREIFPCSEYSYIDMTESS